MLQENGVSRDLNTVQCGECGAASWEDLYTSSNEKKKKREDRVTSPSRSLQVAPLRDFVLPARRCCPKVFNRTPRPTVSPWNFASAWSLVCTLNGTVRRNTFRSGERPELSLSLIRLEVISQTQTSFRCTCFAPWGLLELKRADVT